MITTPILIIAFNRPDISAQTFEYIRKAKPTKLYIAVDGASKGKLGEDKLVDEVKAILQNVDWSCETHYKFNETNKGAEVTVSSAISWVFETEEYAIILEDDIVAPMSFLKFAQEMLIKYKEDKRIGIITGSNFTPIPTQNDVDYFFTKYDHTSGWATWKRFWNKFDLFVDVPNEHLDLTYLKTITNSRKEAKFFQRKFNQIKRKGPGKSTWDNVEDYYSRINNSLTITPRVNLTSNIGTYGLHANGVTDLHFLLFDEKFTIKKHPEKVECFAEYDKYHFKNYINKRPYFFKRLIRKIKRVIFFKMKLVFP